MNYTEWERADSVLRKYNVKPLLGVIPECKDPDLKIDDERDDFWEYLKKLRDDGYTLAMHGCYHLYQTKYRGMTNGSFHSEFAGLPFKKQYELISYGKKRLEEHGIRTDIFFAPAHSYDDNTLKALSKAGFKYMSDGKSKKPYIKYGIKCIPCRSGGVPKIRKLGYYTAVFHVHEWVRADKAKGYDDLRRLCDSYSSDIINFKEYSRQTIGNYFIQRADEILYVFYERNIRPILSLIKIKGREFTRPGNHNSP